MSYPFYLQDDSFVRHRSRQIRQSIHADARHLLSIGRDYAGRLTGDPDVADTYAWLTDDENERMPLLGEYPLTFIDSYPEAGLAAYEKISPNTLALDNGRSEPEYLYELGGAMAQTWTFTFAFNGSTDAVANALFQDLNDRYVGRLRVPPQPELLANLQGGDQAPAPFRGDYITLYNFAATPPIPIVRMEVESFQYAKSEEETAPGFELFFGELIVTDFLPQGDGGSES